MVEATAPRANWDGLEELRGMLTCLLARHTPDANEVDDVIHETFVRAVRYRRNLTDGSRLRSWATRIALNVLSDRKQRAARALTGRDEAGLDAVAAREVEGSDDAVYRLGRFEVDREKALSLLRSSVACLRPEDRALLTSFYRGDQSTRATARECDIPAHLVKIRLFRARRRLVRLMRHRMALGVA